MMGSCGVLTMHLLVPFDQITFLVSSPQTSLSANGGDYHVNRSRFATIVTDTLIASVKDTIASIARFRAAMPPATTPCWCDCNTSNIALFENTEHTHKIIKLASFMNALVQ